MTLASILSDLPTIIPYQELLGNYDLKDGILSQQGIIPYQELLGNYDPALCMDTIL